MIYEFGTFRLDADKRLLVGANDRPIAITPKAFETLFYLVANSGRLIYKDELMSAVWPDTIVEENNLNKNISILRRLLGENLGDHRFIVTVPGTGYKFVATVETTSKDSIAELFDIDADVRFRVPRFRYVFVTSAIVILFVAIAGSIAWYSRRDAIPAKGPQAIAILPFRPLVPGFRDEALELGMADTLISRFGNNRDIVVRPLSSVRGFGKLEQDAVEAGRSLAVDSVLDGNIQRWGDKIRVNVRLINVADSKVLWADTFEEKFTDIFVVQDAISSRLATALALKMSVADKTFLEKRYTTSSEAYALYLRGRFHVFKVTPPEVSKAIGFYLQAIDADTNYALAYAGLADAYRIQAITAHARSKDVYPRAKALALRALEIDESLAEAHIVLGWIGFFYDWDWKAANRELTRAIQLDPQNSEAHRAYAHFLTNSGQHDQAIAEAKISRELAPLTLVTAALEAQTLFYAGRLDDAQMRLDTILELDPNFWVAHSMKGRVFILQGRYDEAIAALSKAHELGNGSTEAITQLGYAIAKAGKRTEAIAVLDELKVTAREQYVPLYFFAVIHHGMGEKEKALDYLEKSTQDREVQMSFLKVDTRWDDLRSEPRFKELMKQINFEH